MEFCCDREFCAEKRLQKPDLYVKLLEAKMNKRRGGLTEWLRSLIGNQVRRQRPVGSSPMSSAKKQCLIQNRRCFYFSREMQEHRNL